MKSKLIVTSIIIATLWIAGCESKQEKVQRLEAEYDKLNAQYRKDCLGMGSSDSQSVNDALLGSKGKSYQSAAMTPEQQAKCKEEKAKLDPLADELLKAQQR